MKNYFLALGRYPNLSLAELQGQLDVIFYNEENQYLIAENLEFKNPRDLPRPPEQLFLDSLGGTMFMGETLKECESYNDLKDFIQDLVVNEAVSKIGFCTFGVGKNFLPKLIGETKDFSREKDHKLRIENFKSASLSSGQIFERRLTQKGLVLGIAQEGNQFLVSKIIANQNLRNYELRDRKKNFRDAKMGMLPPKLAQILINLSHPDHKDTIIDPFCGSATVNIEAAIAGFKTQGSDINEHFVTKSRENFDQMSEKFRYEKSTGTFETQDVTKIDWKAASGIIATEGWLGENFEQTPSVDQIKANKAAVLNIWRQVFLNLKDSNIRSVAFCLPCWNVKSRKFSISQELISDINAAGFELKKFPNQDTSFIYERETTFVAREILVAQKVA